MRRLSHLESRVERCYCHSGSRTGRGGGQRGLPWLGQDHMGGKNAERKVSQGAAGAVWLTLDAPQDFTGNFTRDGKVIPW